MDRKNKETSKKDRKNKKASKRSKKSRKNQKRKSKQNKYKNARKSKSQMKNRQDTSATVPDTCITTAVNALYNGLSKKATNFDRQNKRIETRAPKIESKAGKASEYNQTLDDLVAANASCPAGNATA